MPKLKSTKYRYLFDCDQRSINNYTLHHHFTYPNFTVLENNLDSFKKHPYQIKESALSDMGS